jgi:AAA+ superfamily predicted ATPase
MNINRGEKQIRNLQKRCEQLREEGEAKARKTLEPRAAYEVWQFLGVDAEQAMRIKTEKFLLNDIPQIHLAFKKVFPQVRVQRTSAWNYRYVCEWGTQRRYFQRADGTSDSCITKGVQFCLTLEEIPFVFSVDEWTPDVILLELIFASEHEALFHSKFEQLQVEIRSLPHYLNRQVIDVSGQRVNLPAQKLTLDDIALPHSTYQLLIANIIELLTNQDRYRAWNMPLTRGIVLHGPPGNGKTMIGRALAAMGLATFIFVRPEDLCEQGIKEAFKLARRLSPAIMFFEDIDFIAGSVMRDCGSPTFAEFLVQLDSLERNDGLITIATTNCLEKLDPAIKDRPNRFDVIIPIDPPQFEARRKILKAQLDELAREDVIDIATKLTDGLSGAQVKEMAIRACQAAIYEGVAPGALATEHFYTALAALCRPGRTPVGFGGGR